MPSSPMNRFSSAFVMACLTVSLAACGGDAGLEADIRAQLETEGMPTQEADCVASILVGDVDGDVLRQALATDGADVPESAVKAMERALDECFTVGDQTTTTTTD